MRKTIKKIRGIMFQTISHAVLGVLNFVGFILAGFNVIDFGEDQVMYMIFFGVISVLFFGIIGERHLRFKIESDILDRHKDAI